MNPFSVDSPPPRIAPSVSSPSLLARERPLQETKRLPRPFLLRSTTPLKAMGEEQKNSVKTDGDKVEPGKLSRSKTETALQESHPTRPPLPSSTVATTSSRRSSRPPPNAAPVSARNLPIRASRRITFVPDPSPTPASSSSSSRAPSLPRTTKLATSSVEKVQAVEKRKMELKRESLMSRKISGGGGGGLATRSIGTENVAPESVPTRRWSLRPIRDSVPRRAISNSALNDQSAPPDSPSPSPPVRRNDNVKSNVVIPSSPPRRASIRGPAVPQPIKRSTSAKSLRKQDSYAGLARAPQLNTRESAELVNKEDSEPSGEGIMQRSKTGYTSLQEILAERGYRDTRVLTPNSKARAKETKPTVPPTSLLAPPQPQVKEKTSMLSLRGLFSLWGSPAENQEEGEQVISAEEGGEEDQPPSPNGSGGTVTHSPISRAREWAQGVAIATAQDSDRSPAIESTSFTPPFQYSLSTTEDSPASSRSYSSSIVTASSVRSPPQVTIALPSSTVALSPPSFDRFPSTLSPPKAQAIKSLRHVVSDSTLPQFLPHYTSFPFSPSSVDSTSTDLHESPAVGAVDYLLSPYNTSSSSRRSTPLLEAQTSWLPSSLRQRASQVFSLPMVGLGLTSATIAPSSIFPNHSRQPIPTGAQPGNARIRNDSSGGVDKKKPKLLRKAVSSAGLVRPVLTTTNY